MHRNLTFLLFLLSICFSACKQVAYKAPPPAPAASYLPQTYGSTWTYRDSLFGETTDTVAVHGIKIDTLSYTVNGATTDFNSNVCYNVSVASRLYGNSMAYYLARSHVYALYESSMPLGFIVTQLLVDTASAGYTWTSAPVLYTFYNGNPIQSINTIQEKNITMVVGGRTFENVIHTSANIQLNQNNTGYHNIAYFDLYVAKGVGLIEKVAYYYGSLNETETLLNYSIK
jgi:hypothetical protein